MSLKPFLNALHSKLVNNRASEVSANVHEIILAPLLKRNFLTKSNESRRGSAGNKASIPSPLSTTRSLAPLMDTTSNFVGYATQMPCSPRVDDLSSPTEGLPHTPISSHSNPFHQPRCATQTLPTLSIIRIASIFCLSSQVALVANSSYVDHQATRPPGGELPHQRFPWQARPPWRPGYPWSRSSPPRGARGTCRRRAF